MGGTWARATLPAALASASYDAANQIVQFGGVGLTYDANGNLTSDGARTLTWNARNELTALAGPVSGSFGYDGLGRRRAKTVGGTTTGFLYDGLNPVQELAGGLPAATLVTGLDIDEYFARTDAAGARHVITDALGSTIALTDATGAVPTEYTYEPFGAFTTTGTATGNTFAFTGREADGTGLMYYRARYYDPLRQRFVGEDPIGFEAGDPNLHSYVGNAATDFTDPMGLLPAPFLLPLAGCLGGAGGVALGPLFGRKTPTPLDLLGGCLLGIPFGLPRAWPTFGAFAGARGALPSLGFVGWLERWFGPSGNLFGRGRYRNGASGLFNRGPIRLGWYWNQPWGRNQFGIHWGAPGSSAPMRGHLPLFPWGPRGPSW